MDHAQEETIGLRLSDHLSNYVTLGDEENGLAPLQCKECSEETNGNSHRHSFQRREFRDIRQRGEHEEGEKDLIGDITYRPLQVEDKEQIRALHEQWFPVTYKDDFYEQLVLNRMTGTGDPLFSCVAMYDEFGGSGEADIRREAETDIGNLATTEVTDEDKDRTWDQFISSLGLSFDRDECDVEGTPTRALHDNVQVQQLEETCPLDAAERGDGSMAHRIVGCVVGSFVESKRCAKETVSLLVPNPERHARMFYIMTLGTVADFRNRGLATTLVKKCIEVVEGDPQCGVLYLHVITYNTAAIRFYEKLGFSRVKEIEDYYTIDDENYNCFLYAKYFHGNRGHRTIYRILSNVVSNVWRLITEPVYLVLRPETADW